MGRRKSKFKHLNPKMGKENSPPPPPPPPPWIELPEKITANILKRLGAVEIMESAQKVCTSWRKVCHDPSMWRVIELHSPHPGSQGEYELMCRQAVDRSQGQLVDLTLNYFGDDELLNYVADRSSQLKRLTLQDCIDMSGEGLIEAVKKLPHLEELHLIIMTESVRADEIIDIGISCPMLKSFSFNDRGSKKPNPKRYLVEDEFTENSNEVAQAVAKSMPNLCHLRLFADWMDNEGLKAILDGCPHLESLDIRQCFRLDLRKGALRKRCSQQIKHVKYPYDPISGISWIIDLDAVCHGSDYNSLDDYGYYDDLEDYYDYTNPIDSISVGGTGSETRRRKKVKRIRKAVASSSATTPWIKLPAEITGNILHRLGAIEILGRAQFVCKTWWRICQDPAMWRIIHLRDADLNNIEDSLCRVAVDRSQGQLIEISIDELGDDELLKFIVDRSVHLKRLTLCQCDDYLTGKVLVKELEKLPHLEELHLAVMPSVEVEDIEAIGISCPMLKSFTFNELGFQSPDETSDGEELVFQSPDETSDGEEFNNGQDSDKHARAIAKSMPNLRHLSLICNKMKNEGLEAILDGCPHLESLDLRLCFHIDLEGALGKRCYEQIKHVKGTFDSVSDIEWLDGDSDQIAFFSSPGYKGRYDIYDYFEFASNDYGCWL